MMYTKNNGESAKKRVFIGLLSVSILLILGMIFAGVLIYYNKFGDWYRYILLGVIIFLSIFIILIGIGLAAVVLTLLHVRSFFGLEKLMKSSLNLLFPLVVAIGRIFNIPA